MQLFLWFFFCNCLRSVNTNQNHAPKINLKVANCRLSVCELEKYLQLYSMGFYQLTKPWEENGLSELFSSMVEVSHFYVHCINRIVQNCKVWKICLSIVFSEGKFGMRVQVKQNILSLRVKLVIIVWCKLCTEELFDEMSRVRKGKRKWKCWMNVGEVCYKEVGWFN